MPSPAPIVYPSVIVRCDCRLRTAMLETAVSKSRTARLARLAKITSASVGTTLRVVRIGSRTRRTCSRSLIVLLSHGGETCKCSAAWSTCRSSAAARNASTC